MSAEVLEDDLSDAVTGPLLVRVEVFELFGRYDYEIDMPTDADGSASRLMLLYGDNGSGKTTILRLLFNLLSPADDRGHRSAIAAIPFRRMRVAFNDQTSIRVEKSDGLVGSFTVTLTRRAIQDVTIRFEADDDAVVRHNVAELTYERYMSQLRGDVSGALPIAVQQSLDNQRAEEQYLEFLGAAQINPIFLADDRSLYTDDEAVERARERVEARSGRQLGRRDMEGANQAVARELHLTLGRLNEWLRTLTIRGQSVGSAGANTIYGNVLRQLAASASTEGSDVLSEGSPEGSAYDLLRELEEASPRFEEFELVPHFAASEYDALLRSVPAERQKIAHEILIPYLNSLHARIEALKMPESTLRTLLSMLNGFLVDKRFVFSPREGLRILTEDGVKLPPSSLSSGERQLTMLLCTTLLARSGTRLFIIDEPELSLGIPWQREILSSLLRLTEGTSLQFLVATHSVEMISSQRANLVRLKRGSRGPAGG